MEYTKVLRRLVLGSTWVSALLTWASPASAMPSGCVWYQACDSKGCCGNKHYYGAGCSDPANRREQSAARVDALASYNGNCTHDVVITGAVSWTPTGSASVDTVSCLACVTNLGGSGLDGVRVQSNPCDGLILEWAPLVPAATGPDSAHLDLEAIGTHASGLATLGRARVSDAGAARLRLEADFSASGATAVRVECIASGSVVASIPAHGLGTQGHWSASGGWPRAMTVHRGTAGTLHDRPGFLLEWGAPVRFTIDGTTDSVLCDQVRVSAVAPTLGPGDLTELSIRMKRIMPWTAVGIGVVVPAPSTVGSEYRLPDEDLGAAFPNPTGGAVRIAFRLASVTRGRLTVHSVDGRLVRVLADGVLPAGNQQVSWDGTAADGTPRRAGVYFVRFTSDSANWSRAVTLLR